MVSCGTYCFETAVGQCSEINIVYQALSVFNKYEKLYLLKTLNCLNKLPISCKYWKMNCRVEFGTDILFEIMYKNLIFVLSKMVAEDLNLFQK